MENLPDLFTQINWVDVLFVALFLGMVYRGTKTGVGAQLLSLIGWLVMMFLSVRYYAFVSEAIFGFVFQKWARPLSFLAIAGIVFVCVKLLERVFGVVSGDELSMLEKLGGAFVASVRSFILFGLVGFFLMLLPFEYARHSAEVASKTGVYFMKFDAALYRAVNDLVFTSGGREQGEEALNGIFSRADI